MRLFALVSLLFCFTLGFAQDVQLEDVGFPTNCSASPDPIVIEQSDHTKLTIVGKGNMINHRTESIDGYTIILNNQGVYEYAKLENGVLKASGIKANDPAERNTFETSYLSGISPSLTEAPNPLKSSILDQVRRQILNKTYPTTGTINVLALLIDFRNLKARYTKTDFDSLLNGLNYNNGRGSFKTYYTNASKGQLTINVDLVGWITIDSNYIHFANDSGSARAANLVRMAVDTAEMLGVNFSKYDNDNDGNVDGIMAIHSGPGAEVGSRTQYIWSHRWVLRGGTLGRVRYDGVWIDDYMINPEIYSGTAISGIGVMCHEFGHNLGLPDLYDTDDSNGKSQGIGEWGIMGSGSWLGGGQQPGGFCAWSRVENGWDTPMLLTVDSDFGNYSLKAASNNKDEVFRINTPVSSEYFLLENRQKVGVDAALPGTGMAIWHINTLKTNAPGNQVNGDVNLKGVDLEEADGLDDLDKARNRGDNGDLYPGLTNNRTFNDNTYPHSNTYNSNPTGIKIKNITQNGQVITFDFGECKPDTLTADSGLFSDYSGIGKYQNNQSCSWLIQPTKEAKSITLSFLAFKTESNNDVVTIYDGKDDTAPILARYSGQNIPANVTSTTGEMYIEFKTNGSVIDSGWTAKYVTNQLVDSLTISQDTIYLTDSVNSTALFSILSNSSWDIQYASSSWLTINPMNGKRNTQVEAKAIQNNTKTMRGVMVYAKTVNRGVTDSVMVIQDGIKLNLEATPDSIVIGGEKDDFALLNITSNVPQWNITTDVNWLSITPNSGSLDDIVILTVTEDNITKGTRLATVRVSADIVGERIVKVYQKPLNTVGLAGNELESNFSIYPNPTTSKVTIKLAPDINSSKVEITLFNVVGAELPVIFNNLSSQMTTLDLSGFPAGIYFLVIDYEGKRMSKKISLIEE